MSRIHSFLLAAAIASAFLPGTAGALELGGISSRAVLGQTLWLHTGAALGFSLALVVLTGKDAVPWRVGTLLGLGVGVALACRPVDVVLAAGFAVALWQVRPRALKWMRSP